MGKSDTSSGALCTGFFKIERVSPAVVYDLQVETVESLGFAVTAPATVLWSEWFQDPAWNPTNNLPWAMAVEGPVSYLLQSRFAHGTSFSLGTLFIAPGTVIESLYLNLPAGINAVPEPVTRPVVSLDNRFGRPVPFTGSIITATVAHDYELDFSSASWQVIGGATTSAGTPTTTTQPAVLTVQSGPWTTTWTTSLPGLIPSTGTTVLQFRVRELPFTGTSLSYRPPSGILPVIGVNELRF